MKQIRTAKYDGQEIIAEFRETWELVDYGDGTQTFWQGMGDIEVTSMTICGIGVKMSSLPESLHDGIIELADECEWVA